MRVLLDHDVDVRMRHDFPASFAVETTAYRRWREHENGALLRRAAAGFDAFVTLDGGIPFQQSLPDYALRVAVLKVRAQERGAFRDLVPGVVEAFATLQPGEHAFVADEARAGGLGVPGGQRVFVVRAGTGEVAAAETPAAPGALFSS